MCPEYENISKLIEENSAAINADHEQKNDDLYSKSYDLFYFQKYYLLAPLILLNIAHSSSNMAHNNNVNFGQDFIECIEIFKTKNKDILDLAKTKFKNKMYGTISKETSEAILLAACKELPSQ